MTAAHCIACFTGLLLLPLALPAVGAEAFQAPERKAGCWEHTAVQGLFGKAGSGGSTYECVDAASEQVRLQGTQSADTGNCTQGVAAGGGLAWDKICTSGAVTTKLHMETSGDFQSAYSTTIISSTMRPGSAPQVSKVVANAKWISSSCPASMTPGSWLLLGGEACTPEASGN